MPSARWDAFGMHHVEDESLNNIVEVLFARINPGLAFDPYLEFSFDSIKGGALSKPPITLPSNELRG